MVFAFYALISAGVYLYFYRKTKDPLNPFGISVFSFLIVFAFSNLNLSIYQEKMSILTHILVVIPSAEIFLTGLFYVKKYRKEICSSCSIPQITRNYKSMMWLIVLISFGSAAFLIISRGIELKIEFGLSGALNYRKAEVTEKMFAGSGMIAKLAMIYPYTIVFVMYDFLFAPDNSFAVKLIEIFYCIMCVLYTLLILASRGTLLLSVLGVVYMCHKKYHFKLKAIAGILIAIILVMTAYMEMRVVKESAVFTGVATNSRVFNSIYNYFALAFNNFDMLVADGSPFTGITYSFITFSKIFGIYNASRLINHQTLFFNSKPFVYGFYHDLGILGVMIYPAMIYMFIGKLYVESKKRHPEFILLLAMFGKAMFVLAFGNYFFGSFSGEIQYYACIALLLFGYKCPQLKKIKIKSTFPSIKGMGKRNLVTRG